MSNDAPAATPPADRKVQVTMTISPSLLERIDAAAAAELRTRSNYIEAKFSEFLAEPEPAAAAATHREAIVDRTR